MFAVSIVDEIFGNWEVLWAAPSRVEGKTADRKRFNRRSGAIGGRVVYEKGNNESGADCHKCSQVKECSEEETSNTAGRSWKLFRR